MHIGFAAEARKMPSEPCVEGDPRHADDVVTFTFYGDVTAKVVIERDDSILTPAEKIEHREACNACRLPALAET
eukprot:6390406-Pyramimonas_sp.AAC.1